MLKFKVKEGHSITYTKITTASDAFVSNTATINYLLSTTSIISMVIDLSCKLIDDKLPQNYITVGRKMDISHLNPTLIGDEISLTVTVKRIENHEIFLEFVVTDNNEVVCMGSCERVVVNKDKLYENAYNRIHKNSGG